MPQAPPAAIAPPPAPPPQPAPRRLPAAAQLPIDPDLPADQPLEPGSGPPALQGNPAARIAASEAALGGARPAGAGAAGGKSSFIAAARRAAQAAGQDASARAPRPEPVENHELETPSLRGKLFKRVKSLFIAASIIAIVIGLAQIAGNVLDFGNLTTKTAQAPAPSAGTTQTVARHGAPDATASIDAKSLMAPKPLVAGPLASPPATVPAAAAPLPGLATQKMPSLFRPPMLGTKGDITGSIPHPAANTPAARASAQPGHAFVDRLPAAIGGAKLRNAAIAGDGVAAYEVAVRFAEGRGVPANLEEAARWYERAASKGVTLAQFRYASMLEKGLGLKKDLAAARRFYMAAAAKGSSKAMHNLAVLYAEGIDGKPDYATAVQWFRKAAQHGIADSQYNLGVLCARGLGTPKSYAEAYKWFALAAAQGDQESGKKRDEIASHMDAAALAAARQTVARFVPELQPQDAISVREPPGGWDRAASTAQHSAAVPATPPHGKRQPAAPLSLGSFRVGNR
jgi:localization factor PodJL